jgi:uncharacterized membrane protein
MGRDRDWAGAAPQGHSRRGGLVGERLLGGMAIGWGSFNLVEGLIDHHLLGLHHVKEHAANPLAWDIAFLVFGAVLVLVGTFMALRTD